MALVRTLPAAAAWRMCQAAVTLGSTPQNILNCLHQQTVLPHCWQPLQQQSAQQRQQWRHMASYQTADEQLTPAETFLASLTDWEARGIPASAGIAHDSSSDGSSGSGGGSSNSSGSSSSAFDLRRMRALLAALGNPQDSLRVVHVAGTKGKGSVTTMLAAVLRAAGLRVGAYTSPHLHHITERIQGPERPGPIAQQQLETLVQSYRGAIESVAAHSSASSPSSSSSSSSPDPSSPAVAASGMPTHFEVVTALALRHFADQHADIAVIEAGLGGATDATNVFAPERLQAAVITPIGLDHVAALGGSLHSIAAAKAGIMKAGRPVVLAQQEEQGQQSGSLQQAYGNEGPLEVLLGAAKQLDCPVVRAEQAVQVEVGPITILPGPSRHCARQTVSITAPGLQLTDVPMQLVGAHQASNVQAAVAAVLQLRDQGWDISDAAVAQGLSEAFLPGRVQVVRHQQHPHPVILDGAHTAASAGALATTIRAAFGRQPLALVLAMASDKEHREVIAELRAMEPKVVVFTGVSIAGSRQRAAPPGALAAQWQAAAMLSTSKPFRCRELIQASLSAAVQKARHELGAYGDQGVVVITGSLHAVAAAMKDDLQLAAYDQCEH